MKVTKSQLEAMIRESVEEEMESLNEEELDELLGGLKGMFGGAAKAVGSGIAGAAQKAGGAIAGAARGAGQAVSGAAQKVGGAVKTAAGNVAAGAQAAYQTGEVQAALGKVKDAMTSLTKVKSALPPQDQGPLDQIIQGLNSSINIMAEHKTPTRTLRRKTK